LNPKPLAGLGVLVTRPEAQAARTAASLTDAGAEVFLFPALSIEQLNDASLDAALARLDSAAIAIFVSANAAEYGIAALRSRALAFHNRTRVAAIGNATRDALSELGVKADITPSPGNDSEALLAHDALQAVTGQPIIVFRGVGESGGRQLLTEALTARGAEVIHAECYRRGRPELSQARRDEVLSAFSQGRIQAVHAMSVETLDNLIGMLGESGAKVLKSTRLIVPHERIADAAQERGFADVTVAGLPDRELIEALKKH
jgi:uroporphyrinogen-III synthase